MFFKPFESGGKAWNITFRRIIWGLLLFQVFVTGLFSLRKKPIAVLFMVILLAYTTWWGYVMNKDFTPLSKHTALCNIFEVQNGEEVVDVAGIPPAPRSQQHLNLRRYAVNDETLYVAPADSRTDYSQPPMNMFYDGVLNTGRRRYAHPALNGKLPRLWLPAKVRAPQFGDGAAERRGVVLSLRRRATKGFKRGQTPQGKYSDNSPAWPSRDGDEPPRTLLQDSATPEPGSATGPSAWSTPSNPWRDPSPAASVPSLPEESRPSPTGMSFDWASGVMAFPDEHAWCDEDDDEHDGDSTPETGEDAPASPVSVQVGGGACADRRRRIITVQSGGVLCRECRGVGRPGEENGAVTWKLGRQDREYESARLEHEVQYDGNEMHCVAPCYRSLLSGLSL